MLSPGAPATTAHFNPRSPRGGATRRRRGFAENRRHFNPRSPRGGATFLILGASDYSKIFQSTLPTRGSDVDYAYIANYLDISIHAPHEGERQARKEYEELMEKFQSTLPTRGSDIHCLIAGTATMVFQSTLPTRGSDPTMTHRLFRHTKISIHAPHEGERPYHHLLLFLPCVHFNPRSPRGGATTSFGISTSVLYDFNPRSPRGGATFASRRIHHKMVKISIHAPHEGERPPVRPSFIITPPDFNPRSPRGGATIAFSNYLYL